MTLNWARMVDKAHRIGSHFESRSLYNISSCEYFFYNGFTTAQYRQVECAPSAESHQLGRVAARAIAAVEVVAAIAVMAAVAGLAVDVSVAPLAAVVDAAVGSMLPGSSLPELDPSAIGGSTSVRPQRWISTVNGSSGAVRSFEWRQ
eukprot:4959626-Amphidinium_carterae.1